MVNGSAAAQWLLNLGSVDPGLCLYYVWQAYKTQGASTDRSAGTALGGWNQSDGKHPGDRNPPAGAAVWWGRRYDGNTDGDVTISLGGGRVAATDFPGWRQTGSATLDERQAQIGREYLGWTESIFDCPIDLGGTGGNAAASWNRTDRSTADIQRVIGANPDGIPGPETDSKLRAWQAANRLDADGIFGVLCDAVAFPLVVDGDPGVRTWAKLQHRVGASIDGNPGPETWSRLQTALGVPADGQPGPVTYAALQRAIGANTDGDAGVETWSKLQAFLNTGAPFTKVGQTTPTTPKPRPAAKPRTPVYSGAAAGWDVPLGQEKRSADAVVTTLFLHHETAFTSQVEYFKTLNGRESCPTWEVNGKTVTEMIDPAMRPSSTGSANDYSVAIETTNIAGEPDWKVSDDSVESIIRIGVWLVNLSESANPYLTAPDGSKVRIAITADRAHIKGHKEAGVNATRCPGEFLMSKLDYIVEQIRARTQDAPVEPKPDPNSGLTPDAATFWQRLFEWLRAFFKEAK